MGLSYRRNRDMKCVENIRGKPVWERNIGETKEGVGGWVFDYNESHGIGL